MSDDLKRPRAVVALVEREDGKVLVVWSKRYERWTLPGGNVVDGWSLEEAASLKVRGATNLVVTSSEPLYDGTPVGKVGSGPHVYVRSCRVVGEEREGDPGCPVTWFTRAEYLLWGVLPDFYAKVFAASSRTEVARAEPHDYQCDGCGKTAAGSMVSGWVSPPPGWFVMETDTSVLACSLACAERLDVDGEDDDGAA